MGRGVDGREPRTRHATRRPSPGAARARAADRSGSPPTREIATITDDDVDGVPIRIYQGDGVPTGLVVYFHGGGYVMGSIGIMDNVARELAHAAGAVVVSVGYRLAPEDPYPAGLEDCERVTRWALANAERLGVSPPAVAVAGESAGGNLAAAVALRRAGRGRGAVGRSGAHLPPAVRHDHLPVGGGVRRPRHQPRGRSQYWEAYSGGRDLDDDPYAVPLGRAAWTGSRRRSWCSADATCCVTRAGRTPTRLRETGVDVDEVCYRRATARLRQLRLPGGEPGVRAHRHLAPDNPGAVQNDLVSPP